MCDELAAFGGGALVRQGTQLPYTALQAALDGNFPFNANYWDKGVKGPNRTSGFSVFMHHVTAEVAPLVHVTHVHKHGLINF